MVKKLESDNAAETGLGACSDAAATITSEGGVAISARADGRTEDVD